MAAGALSLYLGSGPSTLIAPLGYKSSEAAVIRAAARPAFPFALSIAVGKAPLIITYYKSPARDGTCRG